MPTSRGAIRAACLALISALFLLAACGGSDEGASKKSSEPFEILFVSGITGFLGTSAVAVQRGIEAHVDYLNEAGGIDGRTIELTVKDNQSDPTRGVTLVQQAFSGSKKPDLVVPGVSSNEAIAMAPLLTRNKTIGIASAVNPLLNDVGKYPYFFSQGVLSKDILSAAAAFIASTGDVTKAALVVPEDALGQSASDFFSSEFAKKDIGSKTFTYKTDAVDLSPVFQQAAASRPDWIYMEGAGGQVAHLLSGRVKAGAEDIPTIAGITASSAPIETLAKGDESKNLYAALLPTQEYIEPEKRGKQLTELLSRLDAGGPLTVPLSTYAAGWDIVGFWATAVQNVDGPLDGDSMKKALENLPPSDDPQFPLYKGGYTSESHFRAGKPTDVTFAQLTGAKDGMRLTK